MRRYRWRQLRRLVVWLCRSELLSRFCWWLQSVNNCLCIVKVFDKILFYVHVRCFYHCCITSCTPSRRSSHRTRPMRCTCTTHCLSRLPSVRRWIASTSMSTVVYAPADRKSSPSKQSIMATDGHKSRFKRVDFAHLSQQDGHQLLAALQEDGRSKHVFFATDAF